MPPVGSEISRVVKTRLRERPGPSAGYAQAYGLCNVAFGAGAIAGPLGAGWVEGRWGWDTMCCFLGALAAVSALPMVGLMKRGPALGVQIGRYANRYFFSAG